MYVLLWLNTVAAVQVFFIRRIFVFFMTLFLTMLTGKNCVLLYSIQSKNGCLTASDLLRMFTQSMKFTTLYYHVLESAKCDSSNRQ